MRPGTPGFYGDRLRSAREARALTQTALADLLGITRSAVSGYESGIQSPAPAVMRRISEILRVPPHFFLMPPLVAPPDAIFYRSMASATKTSRLRAERRYEWLLQIVGYLRGLVQFPAVRFPSIDAPEDPTRISDRMIEEAATECRRFWGLGDNPISNVLWLIENNGAIISRHDLGSDSLDAFSQWDSSIDTPFIILSSSKESAVRSRFDAAHELGHLLLHRRVSPHSLRSSPLFKLIETQAHKFAGAFLLPQSRFAADLGDSVSLDRLAALKLRWRVSIQAMIMRCENLGIITKETRTRLHINLSARGWRQKELYDDLLEPEQPRFLKRAIEMLVKSSELDISEIPFRVGLDPRDVANLAGLDERYFEVFENPSVLRYPQAIHLDDDGDHRDTEQSAVDSGTLNEPISDLTTPADMRQTIRFPGGFS